MSRDPLKVTSTRLPGTRSGLSRGGRRTLLAVVAAIAVLLGVGVGALGQDPTTSPTAATTPAPSTPAPSTPEPSTSAPATSSPTPAPVTLDPDTGLLGEDDAAAAVSAAPPGTALAALAQLPVQGRAPRTGYDRDQFGSGWVDTDRNGCDTRNDVLARDLTAEQFRPGTNDCVVTSGVLADPYSGTTISFLRGQGTSEEVQIDHVVALSNSWQTGAQQWDEQTRVAFANDPLNLLAVDGPLNQQKGDGDTATWLPPNRAYRCAYVARQVAVKLTYGLWTTPAEHTAMATVLTSCPEEPLPVAG
ncbi:Protein of unknown function [Klenkia soli]|uniref:GmrSD restriction endonucleases C-terminal domain-containing protein n=1 Tax=Klenkia soli TaxID=1052260 RepID=A0A1H0PZ13_9ACTN|nr:HNH endonuclease family protein [Klenkia soli]SDP09649.1 Protein of unknown function [Klenkia soli]